MARTQPAPLVVELGNVAPREVEQGLYHTHRVGGVEEHFHSFGDEAGSGRPLPDPSVHLNVTRDLHPLLCHTTTVVVGAGKTPEQAVADILHAWPHHSGDVPSFVVCPDEQLRGLIRDVFGITDPPPPTALYLNGGRDWVSQQVLGAAVAAATNQGKWIALTANATSPAATDTTLTGEITTASGGLIRAAGTVAHTTGASSSTVSNTFTTNGSDVLPVTVAKAGLLNAASTGTMIFETLFTATATLSAVGDSLALTWTVAH